MCEWYGGPKQTRGRSRALARIVVDTSPGSICLKMRSPQRGLDLLGLLLRPSSLFPGCLIRSLRPFAGLAVAGD